MAVARHPLGGARAGGSVVVVALALVKSHVGVTFHASVLVLQLLHRPDDILDDRFDGGVGVFCSSQDEVRDLGLLGCGVSAGGLA